MTPRDGWRLNVFRKHNRGPPNPFLNPMLPIAGAYTLVSCPAAKCLAAAAPFF